MSTSTLEASETTEAIAPWWHTVLVLVPITIGSVAGAYQQGLPNAHIPGMSPRFSGYFTVLAEEWFVVLLIWLALKRSGHSIGMLVSGRWQTLRMFMKDFGLAAAFMGLAVSLVGFLASLLGGGTEKTLSGITPQTVVELLLWLTLAATAGFCEELIFRGYLMRQFEAWTGKPMIALFLQGVVFGLAHGYYGRVMLAIMVQGWLFGLLARWRKSLRPGMLAHGLQDTVGGIVPFLFK